MLETLPRTAFSLLADSLVLKRLASRYGMRRSSSFARRFVAGETVSEVIAVARALEGLGFGVIFDYLGEYAASTVAASAATHDYLAIISELERAAVGKHLSVKLTQLGIGVDRATSIDNLRRILEAAGNAGFFVRVDMERSNYTDQTFDAFETLWQIGYRQMGIALQAYLRRTPADVERAIALGASVRLVKGEYPETREVAFLNKSEVDEAFTRLVNVLLERGTRPAIATHDPAMVAETIRFAESRGISKDKYEFEMLYGIRPDLQSALVAQGHIMRVCVPFGQQWFAYFMRRLGEQPANLGFVVKSLLRDRT